MLKIIIVTEYLFQYLDLILVPNLKAKSIKISWKQCNICKFSSKDFEHFEQIHLLLLLLLLLHAIFKYYYSEISLEIAFDS